MINDFLENYVGFTAKQSILDDIHKSLIQERSKAIGYENKAVPIVSVIVEDPKSKEILGLGASVPGDLIVDNWGFILAALHNGPLGTSSINTVRSITGAFESMAIWSGGVGTTWEFSINARMQVGSGTTPPARTDFKIETPFANGGIEDANVITTKQGAYNPTLGQVNSAVQISPTAGGGTINEVALLWQLIQAGNRFVVVAHDAISPGVEFFQGQSILPSYTWQL